MVLFRRLLLLGATLALAACQPPGSGEADSAVRFEVHPVHGNMGPAIVRFDTATGALQSATLVGARNWTPLGAAVVDAGPPGRFGFNFVQAKSIPLTFIRLDTQTGEVWRMAYPRDREWVALRNPGEAAPPPDPPPAQRRDARAPGSAAPRPVAPEPTPIASPAPRPKPKPGQTVDDIPAYVQGMESEHIPVGMRAWAVEQLGNVQSPEAVPPLLEALEYDDPVILRSAIRALAKHDDPRVKPALEAMTHNPTPEIARVAKTTLDSLP